MLKEQKQDEFRRTGEEQRFVLIESEWDVTEENGTLRLDLSKLRAADDPHPSARYYDPSSSDELVGMPEGLSLVVNAVKDKLTDRGTERLAPRPGVRAAVFGTTAYFRREEATGHDCLYVTPIAVFARIRG